MTWKYSQATGIIQRDGEICSIGYSGKADCKNNPTREALHNMGPIPRGLYQIQEPKDSDLHGPYVLALAPAMDNTMHGRNGFLIHGDSMSDPGNASQGCIILSIAARRQIWNSGDRDLEVTA